MKMILRILFFLGLAIVLFIGLGILYVSFALPNVGPAPEMNIEITQERVDRGKYLAWHVMMCAECHGKRDFSIFGGPPIPGTEFGGGEIFDHSMGLPGIFVSPNITPYGIGDWTDGEIFRLITTGVTKDGEPIFPIMPYHSYGTLDPEDIKSVIAYLRTLEPIINDPPKSVADFPVNLIMRTLPTEAAFTDLPEKSNLLAYGKYLFDAAACGDCHTNFVKGEFIGPLGGGGREFQFPDGSILRTSNITPHETGILHYTRESFVNRFKMYGDTALVLPTVEPGDFQTIMPWKMYSGMTETDLGAIYEYLLTLEPYENQLEVFTASVNYK